MNKILLSSLVAMLVAAPAAQAHQIWFEQDGKAVGLPLFTGGHEEHPDVVTTSLTMSTQVAGRLAGGRRAPEDVHVVVHGDEDVARRVLASLAITP